MHNSYQKCYLTFSGVSYACASKCTHPISTYWFYYWQDVNTLQANYNYFFKSPWQDMQKICLQKSMNCKSNLPKFMREIYYMSPKIRGTEMYSHGFLEISGFNYIIVLWIFGDIWKLNISKNPWEYISVPGIS